MQQTPLPESGLTDEEVINSRKLHGTNKAEHKESSGLLMALKEAVLEPMFLILAVATLLYFLMNEPREGFFLLAAIAMVAAISIWQDYKSRTALNELKKLTSNKASVIRNGERVSIDIEEIVIGDLLVSEEGDLVAADAMIIQSNDFSINESILTGEAFAIQKNSDDGNSQLFQGTTVISGLAIARVNAIGSNTQLGKIGKSLTTIKTDYSPLQKQIQNFVKKMAIAGVIVFVLICLVNYVRGNSIAESLLKGLTLAMSILPEEIPVAFTTFMAIGAWRLINMGIVVKQTQTVETLGSATVICTDKTGTITENRMELARVYAFNSKKVFLENEFNQADAITVITYAMWASEPIPFDPMEKSLHTVYQKLSSTDVRPQYSMYHEYPLSGKPPMMTHIFEDGSKNRIIATKGAVEAVLACSILSEKEANEVNRITRGLSAQGYRVLAVATTDFSPDTFPETQQAFKFNFIGLVAFFDPPKENIKQTFESFYKAGINVKIITGDNAETTGAIARLTGFKGVENALTGNELMLLNDAEVRDRVKTTNLFTRMFPDAKLRIIKALKENNEIVAMTGDGVNDGPALKAAHIGIAMGKRGTEIAKKASSLILVDDDLNKMIDAVAMGRKIYNNLKKAIQYIISIHIPIILTVSIPLFLGWKFPAIFSPVHVIFMELIMGPTCSIIYENEPIEKNLMVQKPRKMTDTFLSIKELSISIFQGLMITAGSLYIYQFGVHHQFNENLTRTLVFTTLIIANVFLTLSNRSFYYSFIYTLRYKNKLMPIVIGVTLALLFFLLNIQYLIDLFHFEKPDNQLLIKSFLIGMLTVIPFELYKLAKRLKISAPTN
ncbi:cation-translocating P-type ATPase [Solitalea sp. MAHUQ-68]|uniref:Cation-translocating P-type ATPase n=1 Tax=Solitalea agri TaxID=2953739 RepID=A0A9X2F314_9SPHI|nr:cation-translocating P-type ATPase [Solitalea agri]MCO4291451.1 cation-translocating P-type ATPase [Solitalea agri]